MAIKDPLKKVLPLPARSTRQEFSKLREELCRVRTSFEALDAVLEDARSGHEERFASLLAESAAELHTEIMLQGKSCDEACDFFRTELESQALARESLKTELESQALTQEGLKTELESLRHLIEKLVQGQESLQVDLQSKIVSLTHDIDKIGADQRDRVDLLKAEVARVNARVSALGSRLYEINRTVIGSAAATMSRQSVEHLDYHLVDHCNLNCAGCSTFSPLAEKRFADPEAFRHDLERLHELIGDRVLRLHLLGGEPLLHPDVMSFVRIAREVLPEARIDVTTNGLLVSSMSESLWAAMRETGVDLKLTRYPVKLDYDSIVAEAREHGVFAYSASDATIRFFRRIPLNAKGIFSTNRSYLQCPYVDCAQLRDGRLYRCPASGFSDILNRALEKEGQVARFRLSTQDFLDLGETKSAQDVFDFLSNAIPFCQYCDMDHVDNNVTWGGSNRDVREWVDL